MAKCRYTEEQMGDAFLERLTSRRGLPGVGRFTNVYREVDCQRGRPDFVGVKFAKKRLLLNSQRIGGFAVAAILSILKPQSPRRLEYLVGRTGFGRDVIALALRSLLAEGLIEQGESRAYTLASACSVFDAEVTAFELKLNKPRRAVFQAQQYCLFAHRVFIVVPPTELGRFAAYLPAMRRWGIGLAGFDPRTKRFTRHIDPRRRDNPASREHQAYAMMRVASGAAA